MTKTRKPAPKRYVLLNGSPRRKGNTAHAIAAVEKQATQAGIRIKTLNLWDMEFVGCTHCDSCMKKPDKPGCKPKDDLNKVLKNVHKADGVLLASPVYCWSVSGSLSTALDRFYCFFKPEGSLLKDKKLAAIFTAGGDANDGADLCVAMTERLGKFGGMDYRGSMVVTSCGKPKETAKREDLPTLAADLVKSL